MTVAMSVNQFFSPRLRSKLLSFRDAVTDEFTAIVMTRVTTMTDMKFVEVAIDSTLTAIVIANKTCFPDSREGNASIYRYDPKDVGMFVTEQWWAAVFYVVITSIDFGRLNSLKSPPKPAPYGGRGFIER